MDSLKRLFTTAVTCFAIVSVALSQQIRRAKTGRSGPVNSASSQLLEIHAVVTDKQGHIIKNLRKEDFTVFENNNPQAISFFAAETVNGNSPGNPESPGQKSPASQPPTRTVAIYVDT